MNRSKMLALLAALMLSTGCATTQTDATGDEDAAAAAERERAEAERIAREERLRAEQRDAETDELANRVVYFEFDRSNIPSEHLNTLDAHARHLIDNPDLKIRLEGHADERGSREYNIGLGDRRAQAVRRILLFQGVGNDQISTVSYGEERPAVQGHNEQAWAKNRRVEIVYVR